MVTYRRTHITYFNNTPRPGNAYTCVTELGQYWFGWLCGGLRDKPLPGSMVMVTRGQMDHREQTAVEIQSKYNNSLSRKSIWKCRLRNGRNFYRFQCDKHATRNQLWPCISMSNRCYCDWNYRDFVNKNTQFLTPAFKTTITQFKLIQCYLRPPLIGLSSNSTGSITDTPFLGEFHVF